MYTEIKPLLRKYGITHYDIAAKVKRSRPLVSLVLLGDKPDVSGVFDAAIDLIASAQKFEAEYNKRQSKRIAELSKAANLQPAA